MPEKPALKFRETPQPKAKPIVTASWKLEKLEINGDEHHVHRWETLLEYRKYDGEKNQEELNPNSERIIHRRCESCGRVEILSETITIQEQEEKR